jgi:hypothetical protein
MKIGYSMISPSVIDQVSYYLFDKLALLGQRVVVFKYRLLVKDRPKRLSRHSRPALDIRHDILPPLPSHALHRLRSLSLPATAHLRRHLIPHVQIIVLGNPARERRPGLRDEAGHDGIRGVGEGVEVHGAAARRLAEDDDAGRVAAEVCDVVADPFEREADVVQAEVLVGQAGGAGETEDVQTVA